MKFRRVLVLLPLPLFLGTVGMLVMITEEGRNWVHTMLDSYQAPVSLTSSPNPSQAAQAVPGQGFANFDLSTHQSVHRQHAPIQTTTIVAQDAAAKEAIINYKPTQRKHKQIIPGARELLDSPEGHCVLTKSDWCQNYWTQPLLEPKPPPRNKLPCPNNCFKAGWCNHDTGVCVCKAGWTGADCGTRALRHCFNSDDNGFDKDIMSGGWVHSRCSGKCDLELGMCYCPPDTKYGRKVDPAAPPGSKPLQEGRPMYWCQPNSTQDGKPIKWTWNSHGWDDVFGPQGWCNADNPAPRQRCNCILEGLKGDLCQIKVDQFCANQCSGHGECDLGFCLCHEGWYGHDCSRRKAGLPWEPAKSPSHHEHVTSRVPAAEDPQQRPFRKRPFIYIYELPPDYNAKMLQYRLEGAVCISRFFNHDNQPEFPGYYAYSVETVFHELMLTSEHRTLDPEEADFFYVPIYISCLADFVGKSHKPIWPVTDDGAGQWGDRPYRMSMMALDTKRWIEHNLPYWNRSGGTDHIWMFSHDEAPCYQHEELWPSIFLSHWGRLDFPHGSNSSYGADNYSREQVHPSLPNGWLAATSKSHPCHDPYKDLVVPVFKAPYHYGRSLYLGGQVRERDILFFFRGDLGLNREGCVYSRCIRQTIWKLYKDNQWRQKHNVWYGDHQETHGDYSVLLSRSKFCLVIPGDGWSARYEDSMLNGCVPVIIMDNTLGPFESIIDYSKFSIRVAESDVSKLVSILEAVTPEQLKQYQDGVAQAWMRFRWNGLPLAERDVNRVIHENLRGKQQLSPVPGSQWSQTADDDAFSTVMQWLHSRMSPS